MRVPPPLVQFRGRIRSRRLSRSPDAKAQSGGLPLRSLVVKGGGCGDNLRGCRLLGKLLHVLEDRWPGIARAQAD